MREVYCDKCKKSCPDTSKNAMPDCYILNIGTDIWEFLAGTLDLCWNCQHTLTGKIKKILEESKNGKAK